MEVAATSCFVYHAVLLLSVGTSAIAIIAASDTLKDGRNITDGGDTLVSAGGSFTLGFFAPGTGTPSRRYLGVWFSASSDVVWVANRDSPLNGTAGVLVINGKGGLLLLLDGAGRTVWSSSPNRTTGVAAAARLLESGNLVVREQGGGGGAILWQSFDHPSNTLLPGMRLGKNPRTGAEWSLASWRSPDDPATGDHRRVMDTKGLPECVSWHGDSKTYRSGPWNGLWFSGAPEMASYSAVFTYQVVVGPDEVSYAFGAKAGAPFSRLVLNDAGVMQRLVWDSGSKAWDVFGQAPRDLCDSYAKCGVFGLCDVNAASTSFCSCVKGFSPASPSQWSIRETSAGCRRDAPLECARDDGFTAVRGVKLPDTDNTTVDLGATLEECRARCLANCSCVAYAAGDIRGGGGGGGSGCVMWMGAIVDVRYVDKGQDLYVRLAKSELDYVPAGNRKGSDLTKILIPVAASLVVVICIFLIWICKFRGKFQNKHILQRSKLAYSGTSNELGDENIELPFVSFEDIAAATNNFSEDHMLGQGGFGKVYKVTQIFTLRNSTKKINSLSEPLQFKSGSITQGMLDDIEVAIKRLDKGSGQGVEEFKNEAVLIARLQHRNLVRLLACCIHGDEKLLIYEYMPNKSLDFFIFDATSKYVLDWPTRFKIIKGVARGLLYLHQDSRLTIIHRDLKSSNILLDVEMSPKISDFGMARIFCGNQQEANTNRVAGTYGYMSPEYALDGAFSVKSDTYSFGVIIFEIISGLKISLPHSADFHNLLAYAWSLWKDSKAMDLVDSCLAKSFSLIEVLRCIHIGLLCVQDNPNDRPLMSTVVFMLENETTSLSTPKQPMLFAHRSFEVNETRENTSSTTNNISLTVLEGR